MMKKTAIFEKSYGRLFGRRAAFHYNEVIEMVVGEINIKFIFINITSIQTQVTTARSWRRRSLTTRTRPTTTTL